MIFSQFSILREICLYFFQEALWGPYDHSFVCADEAYDYGSVANQFIFLVENPLVKNQLGLGLLGKSGYNPQSITHPGRKLEMNVNADNREHHIFLFHLLDRDADLLHHLVTSALEKAHIVGVMDYTHLVTFVVSYVQFGF